MALRPGSQDEVLSNRFNIRITRRDLYTLTGLEWLNDEVCVCVYGCALYMHVHACMHACASVSIGVWTWYDWSIPPFLRQT